MQAHGINPYLYLPAAPELAFLRDDEIYTSTNRSEEAPTIYPPMAQIIFAAIGQVWSSLTMVKLTMAGFEAVAILCVAWLLRRAGQPVAGRAGVCLEPAADLGIRRQRPYRRGEPRIYGAGHGGRRPSSRRGLGGWRCSGWPILCKLLPAAVFPAFWRRWDWRTLCGHGCW